MEFELTEKDENNENITTFVSEMEYRQAIRREVEGKMLPSRIEKYINWRVEQAKIEMIDKS